MYYTCWEKKSFTEIDIRHNWGLGFLRVFGCVHKLGKDLPVSHQGVRGREVCILVCVCVGARARTRVCVCVFVCVCLSVIIC